MPPFKHLAKLTPFKGEEFAVAGKVKKKKKKGEQNHFHASAAIPTLLNCQARCETAYQYCRIPALVYATSMQATFTAEHSHSHSHILVWCFFFAT